MTHGAEKKHSYSSWALVGGGDGCREGEAVIQGAYGGWCGGQRLRMELVLPRPAVLLSLV